MEPMPYYTDDEITAGIAVLELFANENRAVCLKFLVDGGPQAYIDHSVDCHRCKASVIEEI